MDELKQAEAQQEQLVAGQKRESMLVKQMMDTEGFQLLKKVLEQQQANLLSELLIAKDSIDIYQLQAEIKTIKTFLNTADYFSSIQS